MANKTKVTPQKDKVPEKEGQETPSDRPLGNICLRSRLGRTNLRSLDGDAVTVVRRLGIVRFLGRRVDHLRSQLTATQV
jgi:hypothetical protein